MPFAAMRQLIDENATEAPATDAVTNIVCIEAISERPNKSEQPERRDSDKGLDCPNENMARSGNTENELGKPQELSQDTTLSKKLNTLIIEAQVPESERQRLHDEIAAAIYAAYATKLDKKPAPLQLPDCPEEMWKRGEETSLIFLNRVYDKELKAGILTYKWLSRNDPSLYKAVSAEKTRKKDLIHKDENIRLPLTESEITDREYEDVKEILNILGEELISKIVHINQAMKARQIRQAARISTLD